MKVIDPNDTTHSISIIPRFNDTVSVTMEITNEATKVVYTGVLNTYTLTDGVGVVNFDLTPEDKSKYSFKLVDNGVDIIYRGKLIATTQETQEYKITTDLYFYE